MAAWNDESRELALSLAVEGRSAGQIAGLLTQRFGTHFSRSAICGLFYRMRGHHSNGARVDAWRTKGKSEGRKQPLPVAATAPAIDVPKPTPRPEPVIESEQDDFADVEISTAPTADDLLLAGILWLERRFNQCTTILNSGESIERLRVCGEPVVSDRSYCAACFERHYYRPQKRTKEEREQAQQSYLRKKLSRFRHC